MLLNLRLAADSNPSLSASKSKLQRNCPAFATKHSNMPVFRNISSAKRTGLERARLRLVGAINFLPAAGGEKSADTGADDGLPRKIIIDGHAGPARRY